MRVAVVGGVRSTSIVLERLLSHGFDVVGVLGYEPTSAVPVSSWADLATQSAEAGVEYKSFVKVNDADSLGFLAERRPDVIFAVGLSQLVGRDLLAIPRLGTVGFHPTRLPAGRGRAPMAWLVESGVSGAATFFEVTEGVDEGGVLAQEPFAVYADDHAEDAYRRLHASMRVALDLWLPSLREGSWEPRPQGADGVSVWGKRAPTDGLINWEASAERVDALVRAASAPHPGAYTYAGDSRIEVPRSSGVYGGSTLAFPGTLLLQTGENEYVVQAGNGAVRVEIHREDAPLRVGMRLGHRVEHEVHQLRRRVADLENRIEKLLRDER